MNRDEAEEVSLEDSNFRYINRTLMQGELIYWETEKLFPVMTKDPSVSKGYWKNYGDNTAVVDDNIMEIMSPLGPLREEAQEIDLQITEQQDATGPCRNMGNLDPFIIIFYCEGSSSVHVLQLYRAEQSFDEIYNYVLPKEEKLITIGISLPCNCINVLTSLGDIVENEGGQFVRKVKVVTLGTDKELLPSVEFYYPLEAFPVDIRNKNWSDYFKIDCTTKSGEMHIVVLPNYNILWQYVNDYASFLVLSFREEKFIKPYFYQARINTKLSWPKNITINSQEVHIVTILPQLQEAYIRQSFKLGNLIAILVKYPVIPGANEVYWRVHAIDLLNAGNLDSTVGIKVKLNVGTECGGSDPTNYWHRNHTFFSYSLPDGFQQIFFHISDCNIKRFTFNAYTWSLTSNSIIRFEESSVKEYSAILITSKALFSMIKLHNDPTKVILMKLAHNQTLLRFFLSTRQESSDLYTVLSSRDINYENFFVAYNETDAILSLKVLQLRPEMVVTNTTNAPCGGDAGETNGKILLSGEGTFFEQVYEWNIKVLCSQPEVTEYLEFGDEHYYRRESGLILAGVPLDVGRSTRSVVEFKKLKEDLQGVTVSSEVFMSRIEQDTFLLMDGKIAQTYLTSSVVKILDRDDFLLMIYPGESISLLRCGARLERYDPRGFRCRELFREVRFEKDFTVMDFISLRYSNKTILTQVFLLNNLNNSRGLMLSIASNPAATGDKAIPVISYIYFEFLNHHFICGKLIQWYQTVALVYIHTSDFTGTDQPNIYLNALTIAKKGAAQSIQRMMNPALLKQIENLDHLLLHMFDTSNFAITFSAYRGMSTNVIRGRLVFASREFFSAEFDEFLNAPILINEIYDVLKTRIIYLRPGLIQLQFYSSIGSGEIIQGYLPLPDENTGIYAGLDLTPMFTQNINGIYVVIYQRRTDAAVLVYDLRFETEHPLNRLIYEQEVGVNWEDMGDEDEKRIFCFVTKSSFSLHVLFMENTRVIRLSVNLFGSGHSLQLAGEDVKANKQTIEILTLNLYKPGQKSKFKLIGKDYSSTISVTKNAYNTDKVEQKNGYINIPISQLISTSGPITNFMINNTGDAKIFISKSINQVQPSIIKFVGGTPPIVAPTDKVRVHYNSHITFTSASSFSIWTLQNTTFSLLYQESNIPGLLWLFANYESELNFGTDGSGELFFFLTTIEGDFGFHDLKVYVMDKTKRSKVSWFLVKGAVQSVRVRLEIIGREIEDVRVILHYRKTDYNGTTWAVTRMRLKPMTLKERAACRNSTDPKAICWSADPNAAKDTVLNGFKVVDLSESHIETPWNKPCEVVASEMIKLTAEATLVHFWFEESSEVGVLYADGDREHFSYHRYSDTCRLRTDGKYGCYVQDQNLRLICAVQCDSTRIENFVLDVHVENLPNSKTSRRETYEGGVTIAKGLSYLIPFNHAVIQLIKGQSFDVLVTQADEDGFLLFYDCQSGEIFYMIEGKDVCSPSPACLRETYIYQMTNSFLVILPKNMKLDEGLYLREPALMKIPVTTWERKHQGLGNAILVIKGLNDTKIEIPLDSLFDLSPPEWIIYLRTLIILASLAVLSCCCLLCYHWFGIITKRKVTSLTQSIAGDFVRSSTNPNSRRTSKPQDLVSEKVLISPAQLPRDFHSKSLVVPQNRLLH